MNLSNNNSSNDDFVSDYYDNKLRYRVGNHYFVNAKDALEYFLEQDGDHPLEKV